MINTMTPVSFNITSKLFYGSANNKHKPNQLFIYTMGFNLI